MTDVKISVEDRAEFDQRLARARLEEIDIQTTDDTEGQRVAWSPQPGSQLDFIQCPLFEVLLHGTRGGGKTDGLLVSFAQYVGKGFGPAWRGILFRKTYPQLADIVAKSEKWFRQIFPSARFNRSRMEWNFAQGEALLFRHMARREDIHAYQGHEYPWIGFEELTLWPDDECYKPMFACCRSSAPDMPRMLRSTTNPYGPGLNWVKDRFLLAGQWADTIYIDDALDFDGNVEPPRCAIHSHIDENIALLKADPNYKQKIAAAATSKPMAEAWLRGDWDIVAGGMFDDVWSERNIAPDFHVPHSWRIDRAFDWGSSRPFSVGWYAQSDGTDLTLLDGRVVSTVRGDLFRVREWYGFTGKANDGLKMLAVDVAKGIIEREVLWGWRQGDSCRVRAGPADSQIYTVENGVCIANDMATKVRVEGTVYQGVNWTKADKRPGSRKLGWEMMRKMISHAQPNPNGGPREAPALFVVDGRNPQFLRTVLSLPRDEKDMDDVDSDAEDHIGDEVRYRIRAVGTSIKSKSTVGMY